MNEVRIGQNIEDGSGTNDEFLTIEEWLELGTLINQKQVPLPEAPVERYKPRLDAQGRVMPGELFVMEQSGLCRLSDDTRRKELERIAEYEKDKHIRKVRGQGKRRRGKRHHNAKKAALKRRLANNWAKNPFGCILHRSPYACKKIDRGMWDRLIAPLWEQYPPENLTIEFPRTAGTKANPWTIYNMVVRHKEVTVYNGENQLLFDLSSTTAKGMNEENVN